MTTYHLQEEYDDKSNGTKRYLSSRQENNDDEVYAIRIKNIIKSKVMKNEKNLLVQNI